jgi:nucleoside 2-deoxyribosyltransferase
MNETRHEIDMNYRPKGYLAGPYGFCEAGREYMAKLTEWLEIGASMKILSPWTALPPNVGIMSWDAKARWIAKRNVDLIKESDFIVAGLDDGIDVDSGTASEIAFAHSQGIPIFGYRTEMRSGSDSEGSIPINLQVAYFIRYGMDGEYARGGIFTNRAALMQVVREHCDWLRENPGVRS